MNHSISTYNSNTSSASLTSAEILIRFLYAPRLCDFNTKAKDYESGYHYPFEYGTSHPTIRYEYYDGYPQTDAYWRHCLPWARTLNDNGSNYIPTVTISDGLGRPRVVKKEASVNGQVKRIVSGYADIDALGRKMREYYPDIEDTIYPDSTYNTQITTLSSRFFYDGLDRVTKTIYPDSTFTTSSYTVGTDAFGVLRLETDATDQNGHTSKLFSSVREQNTTTVNPIGATTKFVYDCIGQLSMTISPDGDSTKHTYDLFGRRTNRFHPSSGHTHWDYDPAGNMVRQTQCRLWNTLPKSFIKKDAIQIAMENGIQLRTLQNIWTSIVHKDY